VMGNSLATYLFEKIIVYKIQVCNHRRLENKRLSSIETEMRESRDDFENYFKLKAQKSDLLNHTSGPFENTKGNVRMVGLPTASIEDGDHIGNDVDEQSKIGNLNR
jgi:hypothetical protein